MDPLPSNYSASPLERLQLDVAARLEADAYFADISVFVLRPRAKETFATITDNVNQALSGVLKKAGKAGAAVFVMMATADATDTAAPGPRLDFEIAVRVEEIPLINMGAGGTRKSCEDIALRVAQLLHLFNPGRGNVLFAAPEALTPVVVAAPKIGIDVSFRQKCGVEGLAKVSTPTISATSQEAGATVTLACATAAAAIRYTTDGSYPSAENTAAQIYAAPFAAVAGTLRVAADLAGRAQSDVRQSIFT